MGITFKHVRLFGRAFSRRCGEHIHEVVMTVMATEVQHMLTVGLLVGGSLIVIMAVKAVIEVWIGTNCPDLASIFAVWLSVLSS